MKLSMLNEQEKVAGRYFDFFLNGDKVNALGVFEASEEEGYVIVAADERTPSGHVRFIREEGSPCGCRTRRLNGEVAIRANVEQIAALVSAVRSLYRQMDQMAQRLDDLEMGADTLIG